MSFDIWISLVILFFMGGLTPGPAIALVLASAFQHGFKPAMLAAIGIASANVIWLLLAASGAMALFTAFPQALIVMKTLGLIVILYLALSTIFGPLPDLRSGNTQSPSDKTLSRPYLYKKLFRRGMVLQLSSPMPLIYFGGLLPAYFVTTQPLAPQVFIMFVTITATELIGLAAYALGADKIKRLLANLIAARIFNIGIGLLMIGAGFWAIFSTL